MIKKTLKNIVRIVIWPYTRIRREILFRKKLKELRKRDPFIYE